MNLTSFLLVLFLLPLMGCELPEDTDLNRDSRLDKHAEYVKSHSWIGKCAKFDSSMVYLTNMPSESGIEEIKRIGRALWRESDARNLVNEGVITPVPDGTSFEVTAVFKITHTGFSKFFNSDFEMAVLRDSQGKVSVYNLGSIKTCD